jgi:hypothetical protein
MPQQSAHKTPEQLCSKRCPKQAQPRGPLFQRRATLRATSDRSRRSRMMRSVRPTNNMPWAYFYHRIITKLEDMAVTNVAELYSRPLSITGSRPLVCSGYAILGARLLTLAGGNVTRFISAVRATDENIRANKIDDGHAIAEVTRGGKTFFVSNDSIFDTEERALDVAWANPDAPLIQATGSTNAAALAALKALLAKKMR